MEESIGRHLDPIQHALKTATVSPSPSREVPEQVYGVIFCGFPKAVRVIGEDVGALLYVPFCTRLLSNPAIPRSLEVLRWFREILRVGDHAIRLSSL